MAALSSQEARLSLWSWRRGDMSGCPMLVEQAAAISTSDPPWLREIREAASERFAELGFPTTRDEDWRFTNVAPLARISFDKPVVYDGAGVPKFAEDAFCVVFV